MQICGDHELTFKLVFEYQPIASKIYQQPSRYKRAESNLLADEKVPHHMCQVVVRGKHIQHILIHLFL